MNKKLYGSVTGSKGHEYVSVDIDDPEFSSSVPIRTVDSKISSTRVVAYFMLTVTFIVTVILSLKTMTSSSSSSDESVHYVGGIYVDLIAGNGSELSYDGTGSAAAFSYPMGIALNSDETTLYVADFSSSLIRKIDIDSQEVMTVDTTDAEYTWNGPIGLVVDSDGNIYVSDSNRISKVSFDDDGEVDSVDLIAGSLYFGDSDGNGNEARFFGPHSLVLHSSDKYLYFSDMFNGKVRVVDNTDSDYFVKTVLTDLNEPSGLAIDKTNGNMFVATASSQIIVHNLLFGTTTSIGSFGISMYLDGPVKDHARFMSVIGLSSDNLNNLYIVDDGGHTVRYIDAPSQTLKTLGGLAESAGYVEGKDSVAKFSADLNFLACNSDGSKIYVADSGNNRIRVISWTKSSSSSSS